MKWTLQSQKDTFFKLHFFVMSVFNVFLDVMRRKLSKSSMRSWRDGSEVTALNALPQSPGSISSTHTKTNNYLQFQSQGI